MDEYPESFGFLLIWVALATRPPIFDGELLILLIVSGGARPYSMFLISFEFKLFPISTLSVFLVLIGVPYYYCFILLA